MSLQDSYILMTDGTKLYLHRWITSKAVPTCVILITHGMGEHGGRYTQFAEQMNVSGIVVYAPDLRGHGLTAGTPERMGHVSNENGWELLVDDLHELTQYIRSIHPDLPVFMLGHSMGSLLARRFIQRFGDDIDGVILTATGGDPGTLGKLGLWIAHFEIKRLGPNKPSKLLKRLLFGNFNRHFHPRTTGLEWLNRDEREIQLYLKDQRIATSYSAAFFRDLIKGTLALHQSNNLNDTPSELPILLLSGEKDALGNFTKNVKQTYHRFKAMNCQDISMKLYPGARHEILHEFNRKEVFADIADWINQRCNIDAALKKE